MAGIARAAAGKVRLSWVDLRGSGLSAIERLCLEEALLRHDPKERCWAMVGNHDPTHHTHLTLHGATQGDEGYVMPDVIHNRDCAIVLGFGGKPEELLDVDMCRDDGVLVIRRFSGGGTVVVDHSCLWTTFIGRTKDLPNVHPYPRDIMRWSADTIFASTFAAMKDDALSAGGSSTDIPDFELRENDYVLGEKKIAGNAQSIVKGAWLHHTSFLWDYVDEQMNYLTLPEKRPDYRGDRSHADFLIKLKKYYGRVKGGKRAFFHRVKEAAEKSFELEDVSWEEALAIVDSELGGMQQFFDGKCRTRVVEL